MPSRRSWWALGAGAALAGVLLWWVLRDVHWADLRGYVAAADPLLICASVAAATATFPLRLVRWRLLLRADDGHALPALPLWHAIAMGFMANNILPFRMGELMRTYAASRLAPARFSATLSSVAVARVFDGLTVIALLATGLLTAGVPADVRLFGTSVAHVATWSGMVVLLALAAGLLVVSFPALAEQAIRKLVPSESLAARLVALVEGIRHGLTVLRSPVRSALVVWWSVVMWLVNASAFWLMFRAFSLPVGFAGALLLQGVVVLGIAAPATPGYVGVFEAIIKAVLLLFGVAAEPAVAYAVTYHLTTFLPIVLLGVWSLLRTSMSFGSLRAAPDR